MKLANKTALVTGAGGGMGRTIARALANEGADLMLCDINENSAKVLATEIRTLNRRAIPFKTDVTKAEEVTRAVQKALETFQKIDILVNTAGILTMAPVIELTEKEWDEVMSVNAKGVFLFCQAVAKPMIKQGSGKIVNIASDSGKTGEPHLAHYCASKHAVVGFTESFAIEMAEHKVYVNAVCPALTNTNMMGFVSKYFAKLEGSTAEEMEAKFAQLIPLGRVATPDDVAKVVIFLVSSDSDYITGQSINVTGGGALKFCVSE